MSKLEFSSLYQLTAMSAFGFSCVSRRQFSGSSFSPSSWQWAWESLFAIAPRMYCRLVQLRRNLRKRWRLTKGLTADTP